MRRIHTLSFVCLLVTADSPMRGPSVRRVDRDDPEAGARAEPITEGVGRLLLDLPATQAAYDAPAAALGKFAHLVS